MPGKKISTAIKEEAHELKKKAQTAISKVAAKAEKKAGKIKEKSK